MPSNIEIKAALTDRASVEATATRLSDSAAEILYQQDFFFGCRGARLKLRIFHQEHGELIRYERANSPGVRRSYYEIARTSDPVIMLQILTATLGVTGVVKKKRTLYRAINWLTHMCA